jgi:hypothetical protein
MNKVAIALPDTAVSDVYDIRDKTSKLATIARTAALFEVSTIFIYKDQIISGSKADYERRVMKTILSYIETPQYLRKLLFPFHKDLKYAGQLPPLATFHHPIEEIKANQFRDGVAYLTRTNKVVVEVGAEEPLSVINNPGESLKGKRLRVSTFIRREDNGTLVAEIVPRDAIETKLYWGYTIKETNNPLQKFLKKEDYIVIGTSKQGENYKNIHLETNEQLLKKKISKKPILLVFGSPKTGLPEMLKGTGVKQNEIFDLMVNTVPNPGTRSVRLEEAIMISLARLLPIFE